MFQVWKVEPVEKLVAKLRKVFDANFDRNGGPIIVVANSNHEVQVISSEKFLSETIILKPRLL